MRFNAAITRSISQSKSSCYQNRLTICLILVFLISVTLIFMAKKLTSLFHCSKRKTLGRDSWELKHAIKNMKKTATIGAKIQCPRFVLCTVWYAWSTLIFFLLFYCFTRNMRKFNPFFSFSTDTDVRHQSNELFLRTFVFPSRWNTLFATFTGTWKGKEWFPHKPTLSAKKRHSDEY